MTVVLKEKVATLEQKKFVESIREIHHDPMIPNAMVDRLTHKATIVDMNGDSYRLKETMDFNEMSN